MRRIQYRPYDDLLGRWYAYRNAPIIHRNGFSWEGETEWFSYVVYPQPEPIDVDLVACRGYN